MKTLVLEKSDLIRVARKHYKERVRSVIIDGKVIIIDTTAGEKYISDITFKKYIRAYYERVVKIKLCDCNQLAIVYRSDSKE